MKVFYEKKESNQKIVYVEKPYSFYVIVIIAIASSLFEKELTELLGVNSTYLFTGIMFFIIICRLCVLSTMRREIAKAMKEGSVKTSGSRFSLFSPLTTEISK
jgi:hypothetical protein